jgi:hypothetical protein
MPRSRAITGALTRFTSGFARRRIPAITAQFKRGKVHPRRDPVVKHVDGRDGLVRHLPDEVAQMPGKRIHGPITRASSAVTDGMLSALVTAPVSR